MPSDKARGMLESDYARERTEKLHVGFRMRLRYAMVCCAVKEFLGTVRGLNILDMGTAEGRGLLIMRQALPVERIIGVEFSESLVVSAPEFPPGVGVVQGDVTKLPAEIERGTFDVVCALAVLEHLDDPVKAVREAREALKPGGILVITSPVPFWEKISVWLRLLRGAQHHALLNVSAVVGMLEHAGMEFLGSYKFMLAPVGFAPYLGIPVSTRVALGIDRVVRAVRILDWMFVNQCVIGKKPKQ